MKFVVASTNTQKILAAQEALDELHFKNVSVTGVSANSNINEQPIGMQETFTGAYNRARNLIEQHKGEDTYFIGIENGIEVITNPENSNEIIACLDLAAVCLITPSGSIFYSTSPAIMFPISDFNEAKEIGFKTTTVGQIIAKRVGGTSNDPHATLTQNMLNRKKLLVQAVTTVLIQYFTTKR